MFLPFLPHNLILGLNSDEMSVFNHFDCFPDIHLDHITVYQNRTRKVKVGKIIRTSSYGHSALVAGFTEIHMGEVKMKYAQLCEEG